MNAKHARQIRDGITYAHSCFVVANGLPSRMRIDWLNDMVPLCGKLQAPAYKRTVKALEKKRRMAKARDVGRALGEALARL